MGNILAFLMGQYDTSEILVDRGVIIERTGILRGDFNGLSEHGPGLSVDRMAVRRCLDVRACLMNSRV